MDRVTTLEQGHGSRRSVHRAHGVTLAGQKRADPVEFSSSSRGADEPLQHAVSAASAYSIVLEDDLRDDPVPVIHQPDRLLILAGRETDG